MADDDIVITGIGQRCALGNSAVEVAAAIRAGLARLQAWRVPLVGDEPAVAAPVEPDLDDRPWIEKALDLAEQPLHEALWGAGVFAGAAVKAAGRSLAVFCALPRPGRPGIEAADQEAFDRCFPDDLRAVLDYDAIAVSALDHGAGPAALTAAIAAATDGAVALVVGIDSHLHGPWMRHLAEQRVVHTDERPHGLYPGEGCAAIVVEQRDLARARGATALARIVAVAIDHEQVAPAMAIRAEAQSRAVRACLAAGDPARLTRIITDLNGERWRALEWGITEARCLDRVPKGWQLQHPAEFHGDVGAASAIAAMVAACRSFAGGYHGGGDTLVLSGSPAGERGAILMQAAED
jgi:3-oxoacyl-[acyl-carrier-protein] synthase-1